MSSATVILQRQFTILHSAPWTLKTSPVPHHILFMSSGRDSRPAEGKKKLLTRLSHIRTSPSWLVARQLAFFLFHLTCEAPAAKKNQKKKASCCPQRLWNQSGAYPGVPDNEFLLNKHRTLQVSRAAPTPPLKRKGSQKINELTHGNRISHLIEEITSLGKKTTGCLRAESAGKCSFSEPELSAALLVGNWLSAQPALHHRQPQGWPAQSEEPQLTGCSFPFYFFEGTVLEKQSLQLKLSWRISPSVAQICPQKVTCTIPLSSPHRQVDMATGPALSQGKGTSQAPCELSPFPILPIQRGNNHHKRAT